MLNFIYYPVSFILWCWHKVFGFVLGDTNAVAWALSIVFLVFTLRALLLKPAIKQVRSMRKMQEFQPQMKALQKKYANDRQRQAAEMQKLQKEHGVNPLGGCLPMVFQIPVFIGLNHVLRSFTIYPNNPNYFFGMDDVHSYLGAKLFDAHLGDAIFNTGLIGGSAIHHQTWEWGVAPVAIPLMIIASVATHFTARLSYKRQQAAGTSTSQSKMMGKLTMWVFPIGVLAFGGALPVGLLMYWVSNNVWTFGQQHLVYGQIDKEDAEKKRKAQEERDALAPKPGQKPAQTKKKPQTAGAQGDGSANTESGGVGQDSGNAPGSKSGGKSGAAAKKGGARNDTGITNKPGATGSSQSKATQSKATQAKSGQAKGTASKGTQGKSGSGGGKQGSANAAGVKSGSGSSSGKTGSSGSNGKAANSNGQAKGGSGKGSGGGAKGGGGKAGGQGGSGGQAPGLVSNRSRKKK